MRVGGLAIDAASRSPVILLMDPSGRRQVPIWIDHAQAHNIITGMENPSQQNPLTHDLMIALLEAGNLLLEKVIIHSIEENTFKALLKLKEKAPKQETPKQTDNPLLEVQARPSDAIAIAVRTKCSIWMLEEVVAKASIPVDINADEKDQNEFRQFLDNVSPAALIRHSKTSPSDNEGINQ